MANVLFKKGLQASLPVSRDAGTFYVTTDTHRLYLGNDLLSQAVEVVENINALPSSAAVKVKGQFYYAEAENVLCTIKNGAWVQINPDNFYQVTGAALATGTTAGGATLNLTINQEDQDGAAIGDITTDDITIKGEQGIAVSNDGNTGVKIQGTTYELGSTATTNGINITLQGTGAAAGAAGTVPLLGGKNITIDSATGTIAAKDNITTLTGATFEEEAAGFSLTIKSELDGAGVADVVANLDPVIKYGSNFGSTAHFTSADGGAKLNVYTKDEVDAMHVALNAMHYRGLLAGTSIAPTFAGVALAEAKFEIGDTYKTATNLVLNIKTSAGGAAQNVSLAINDVLIANGTEGTDGKITAESLYFDIIPGGVDSSNSIGYVGAASQDGNKALFEIKETVGGLEGSTVGSIGITAGANLKLAAVDTSGNSQDFTIAHDVAGAAASTLTGSDDVAQAAGKNAEFTAVTSISYDANGHVVSAATKKLTVVDTTLDNQLANADVDVAVAGNVATISTTAQATDTSGLISGSNIEFGIKSESLSLSKAAEGQVGIELVWGSF